VVARGAAIHAGIVAAHSPEDTVLLGDEAEFVRGLRIQ
jgi:hypothetical protein